jgi:hypothetical protein
MVDNSQSEGEFFTRMYIERGPTTRDSVTFRNRLIGYLQANHHDEYGAIGSHAKQELGLIMPIQHGVMGGYYNVPAFLDSAPIKDVLNVITVIWRVLKPRYGEKKWCEFVARAMRDENLGHSIDAYGGVHFLVDEEFVRNRVSVLRGLEALGILARLMEPGSQRLNRQLVLDKLKVSATWLLADAIEVRALDKIFDGIADWVDAMHIYRHGQATEESGHGGQTATSPTAYAAKGLRQPFHPQRRRVCLVVSQG